MCTYKEQSPTLTCTHYGEPAVAYGFQKSINGIDAEEEKQPPLQADTHTKAYTLKIRGGCETYQTWSGKTAKAGKGPLIQIEKSATIAVSQDQILFQPINNPE